MIPDCECNRVYFSALLPEACPVTYRGLVEVLDRYGVPHSLLQGTKDIWCRDYMPLQMMSHEFVVFQYRPDYLLDSNEHEASLTDGYEAAKANGIDYIHDERGIKLDGGNTVHDGGKVILTSKIFEENPGMPYDYLCRTLRMNLGAEPVTEYLSWTGEKSLRQETLRN